MKINTEVELFFPNQNISQIITNPKKWFTTVSLILFTSVTFVCTMKRGKKRTLAFHPPQCFSDLWTFRLIIINLKRLCPPASWTSADRRCRRRASSWRWWWGGPACGGGRPSAPGLSAGRGQREGRGGASYYRLLSVSFIRHETRQERFLLVGRGGRRPCDQKRSASPPGNTSSNSYCQSVEIWRIQ